MSELNLSALVERVENQHNEIKTLRKLLDAAIKKLSEGDNEKENEPENERQPEIWA